MAGLYIVGGLMVGVRLPAVLALLLYLENLCAANEGCCWYRTGAVDGIEVEDVVGMEGWC